MGTLAKLRANDRITVISKLRAFHRDHPGAAWSASELADALGCTRRWIECCTSTLTGEGQLVGHAWQLDEAPHLRGVLPRRRYYVEEVDRYPPIPPSDPFSDQGPPNSGVGSLSLDGQIQADHDRRPVGSHVRAGNRNACAPALRASRPSRAVRRAPLQRPSRPASAAPARATRAGVLLDLDPVQLPPDVLAPIEQRWGAAGLDSLLGALASPDCWISYECTLRAARTLPLRTPTKTLGGYFLTLVREALRGELLVDKLDDAARVREAEAANMRTAYGGLDPGDLDADEHAAAVELLEELILRTQRHDPDKADGYRQELVRLKSVEPRPRSARLAAASNECDETTEGDDDVADIPWDRLFAKAESESDS